MNPKELEENYQENKSVFHDYIDNIKKNMNVDFYSIINPTLICNPYNTEFPKKFFLKNYNFNNKWILFIESSFKFYVKNIYYLLYHLIVFIIYSVSKIEKVDNSIKNHNLIAIDTFLHVKNIIENKNYNERYFPKLFDVLNKNKKDFVVIARLVDYNIKNPFTFIKFIKTMKDTNYKVIYDYSIFTIYDYFKLFTLILKYPFKTLKLLQKENSIEDKLFNNALLSDIKNQQYDAFSRYIFAKKISKISKTSNIKSIYSWNEFQVIERSFNYALNSNSKIKLYGCQFYLNYETYFNAYIKESDILNQVAYDEVLVNGKYYINNNISIPYNLGVSLRYENIFTYSRDIEKNSILLLGSFSIDETRNVLKNLNSHKITNVIFKKHPDTNKSDFSDLLDNKNILYEEDNIYNLFNKANVVITTASGTAVEAVAKGLSVIIIANQKGFTINPLIDFGKKKIWDIAYSSNEINNIYEKLLIYRKKNKEEIKKISSYYKDNFFIEPTEDNIKKVFKC